MMPEEQEQFLEKSLYEMQHHLSECLNNMSDKPSKKRKGGPAFSRTPKHNALETAASRVGLQTNVKFENHQVSIGHILSQEHLGTTIK